VEQSEVSAAFGCASVSLLVLSLYPALKRTEVKADKAFHLGFSVIYLFRHFILTDMNSFVITLSWLEHYPNQHLTQECRF